MYYYAYLIIIIAVVYFTWTMIKNLKTGGLRISPTNAKKRLDSEKGIILLDIRNHDEYIKSHIPNSINISASVLANEASKQLPDKSAEIFVYGASGSRSFRAVNILLKLGFTKVYNLEGIFGWPYETESGEK